MLSIFCFTQTVAFSVCAEEASSEIPVTETSEILKTETTIIETTIDTTESSEIIDTTTEFIETEPIITDPVIETDFIMTDYVEDNPDFMEESTEYIPVTNVVVSEFDNEMYVDETQNLSATVLPSSATNQELRYSSSNRRVAEINAIGGITARGSGTCYIYVEADGVVSSHKLTVKIKTERITVDSKFIVMKVGNTLQLTAKAEPSNASQSMTYKSSDENILVIDQTGIITAKQAGNASVIISNGDMTASVSIIVNSDSTDTVEPNGNSLNNDNSPEVELAVEKIKNADESTVVINGLNNISSNVLKELYDTPKTLVVECNGYDIILNGMDIKNAANELNTQIDFNETNNGIEFVVNNNENIPGKFQIKFKENNADYHYLYIFNQNKNEYEMLDSLNSNNQLEVDFAGIYLLTEEKISKFRINIVLILSVAGIILILSLVYILLKKKYWFW